MSDCNSRIACPDARSRASVVILANGDFPGALRPLKILEEARQLVCCDGAFLTFLRRKPDLASRLMAHGALHIVGDGDSLPPALREQYAGVFHAVSEQDDNDLTKATRYALEHFSAVGDALTPIDYIGCTGRREDHTLANISLMMRYRCDFGVDPIMYTDCGWFVPAVGNARFNTFPDQQMSIFNFSCHSLESVGLRWQVYPFAELWQGTMNACIGSEVTMLADGGYLVYRTYISKKTENSAP